LPQSVTPQKPILIAQAGTEGEHSGAGTHGGETNATVGHGAEHGPPNPLAEYPAWYYSFGGLLVGIGLIIFMAVTTKNLTKRTPSKPQALIEQCVASITHFCRAAIGPGGEKYAPLVGTVFAFILCSNLIGVLPLAINRPHHEGIAALLPAPTTNLSMTFALGLIVFIYSQYVGIKENGLGGHLKHFMGPLPALSPLIFIIEVIGALVRPVSLAMRLFGNIFGEETVTAVLVGLAISFLPVWLPIPLQLPMLMFGIFGSVVQASVFTILTCVYINLSIGEHGDHGHAHDTEHDEAHGGAHAVAH
jgi:F-type H+-transporting ATPase subunit a